jgi:hypothetical protein
MNARIFLWSLTSALYGNTTGYGNSAIGYFALFNNITGANNTAVGSNAGPTSNNLTDTTAIGANALVSESNALVLGGTGSNAVRVGIGTATPSNVFTIAQGAGHAIADGWDTYSSRRWKTNIQTLRGALDKVEQLRGVSYPAGTQLAIENNPPSGCGTFFSSGSNVNVDVMYVMQ